jgi:hypothetical protein
VKAAKCSGSKANSLVVGGRQKKGEIMNNDRLVRLLKNFRGELNDLIDLMENTGLKTYALDFEGKSLLRYVLVREFQTIQKELEQSLILNGCCNQSQFGVLSDLASTIAEET